MCPNGLPGTGTLAACGGGSHSGASSSPAARHAGAEKLIAQAIGVNPKASSGRVDGTIDVNLKGVSRLKGPIEITADGVYNLPAGASVPDLDIDVLGTHFPILGLRNSTSRIDAVLADHPTAANRRRLKPVSDFAHLALANSSRATAVLQTVQRPVEVDQTVLSGRRTPLDTVAVAVAVSLMFVCVLLASGLLALEREENTFARLARGLVPGGRLLTEKLVLAAACSFVVTLVMLLGVSLFVPLDMSRIGLWLVALGGGALGFAAMGVAIGTLAREVRAASLLAFGLALPLAFLALVPSGGVSPALYEVIRVISAIFPFKASLEAIDAAVNGSSPGIGQALAHLAALVVVFGAAARAGLRASPEPRVGWVRLSATATLASTPSTMSARCCSSTPLNRPSPGSRCTTASTRPYSAAG